MCNQQNLRSACAYAQSDQILCKSVEYSMDIKLLTEHNLEFLSLKRRLQRPVQVYTCQNVKLLEISCRGSFTSLTDSSQWINAESSTKSWLVKHNEPWHVISNNQQCGILTSVDSDEPVQPPLRLWNSKWCSVTSLPIIEYASDKQRLWSDCAYAQADLRLCWSHIPHCWKSHVTAQLFISRFISFSQTLINSCNILNITRTLL